MKSNLNFTARADDKEGTATMGLLGNSLGAMMDLMHDAAVEIGQWADMPPAAILATIISVIAVEEDEVRKVVERLGGREEKAEIMKLARLIWDLARALHTRPEKVLERLTRKGDGK